MPHVDIGPIRNEYPPSLLGLLLLELQNAINYIDETNIKNPLNGSLVIKDESLSGSKITKFSLPLNRLIIPPIEIPLILAAQTVSTTSTSGTNFGGYFNWNPSNWPEGNWYFEASISSADSSATATAILKGSLEWASVSTTSTTLTLCRNSSPITMPTNTENLWVVLRTSNSSYAAYLASAKLIFVPK